MDFLNSFLPIVIYVLLIILIILLIIIVIKAMKTLKKVDAIVDNVDQKVKTFDGLFTMIELTTSRIQIINDTIINKLSKAINKLFNTKSKKKKLEKEGDKDE